MSLQPHQERVLQTIREAAAPVLDSGAARLEVTTQRYEDADYDAAVFTLEPKNPRAAGLRVAVDDFDTWTFSAGQTWHFVERMPGDIEDRHTELTQVVGAVIAGRYEHQHRQARIRMLLRPWRWRSTTEFVGRFYLEEGPLEYAHVGSEPAGLSTEPTAYEPYRPQ
jgi:hypothetical protein